MINNKYYKESGNVNFINLLFGIITALITTFIMGYIYSFLIYFVPVIYFTVIYFNVIISIGLGIFLSLFIRLVFRISKIRNKKFRIMMTSLVIIFITYFQWMAYIDSIVLNNYPTIEEYLFSISWIFNFTDLIDIIGQINKHGTWGLGMRGDFPVNGLSLTIVWLFELLIILIPTIKMLNEYKIYPYSEKQDKWYPKFTIENYFESIYSSNSIEPELDKGIIQTLKNLNEGNKGRHSKIHLHFLEKEANQYISIDRVWIEGKGKIRELNVLNNYRISLDTANEIKNLFKLKKEYIDII